MFFVSLGEVPKHCHKHYHKFVGVLMQICSATFFTIFASYMYNFLLQILARYHKLALKYVHEPHFYHSFALVIKAMLW